MWTFNQDRILTAKSFHKKAQKFFMKPSIVITLFRHDMMTKMRFTLTAFFRHHWLTTINASIFLTPRCILNIYLLSLFIKSNSPLCHNYIF